MRVMRFDTSSIPRDQRFETERSLTRWGDIEAIGDPADYYSSARFVSLGDIKLGSATASPVRYRRTQAHIDADERDHLTLRYFLVGSCVASLDGRVRSVGAGEALIMDSAKPFAVNYAEPTDCLVIHIPFFMLQPYFRDGIPTGKIDHGSALDRLVTFGQQVLANASELPKQAAVLLGQSLRSLIVAAMLPLITPGARSDVRNASLVERIMRTCAAARGELDQAELAAMLGTDPASISQALARHGGLDAFQQRQRLIGAYNQLLDPSVALSISQIARAAGYTNDAQFSRDFRQTFDLSPREARARLHSIPPRWAGRLDPVASFASLMTES